MAQTHQAVKIKFSRTVRYNYLLHLPPGYDAASGALWPLILFLHGRGERGKNLDVVKTQGLPKKLESWPACPYIVVSPQCAGDNYWVAQVDALKWFLDSMLKTYAVDSARIYLTGLSMGGQGAWYLANAYPEVFAAVAPICGPTNPLIEDRLTRLPWWVFHGAKDDVVPLSESQRMVDLLKAAHADIQFTVYPNALHDSWTATYDNPALYEWFMKYTKK